MRSSRWIVAGAFAVGAAAGLAAGCQVYDFEPVKPIIITQTTVEKTVIAKNLKPNLMLLVDKSGSMDTAADPSRADLGCQLPDGGPCGVNKNPLCPPSCPTRWTELQGAMSDFLSSSGDVARMGLAIFPNAEDGTFGNCGNYPTSQPYNWDKTAKVLERIDPPSDSTADLQAQASAINTDIQAIHSVSDAGRNFMTFGGTPTAYSLQLLGGLSDLHDAQRANFVLLLTDGVPNCNESYPQDPATCTCTMVPTPPPPCPLPLLCLDDTGSRNVIGQNANAGIKTIVVGFGAETGSGSARAVLNAMASAGGFPRKCFADGGGCAAGDTCGPNNECTNIKYYQATNRAELAAALAEIGGVLDTNPCEYALSSDPQNFDPQFLVVFITEKGKDPVRLTAGPNTYSYSPGDDAGTTTGYVHLLGDTCTLVSNATPDAPVKVEIRFISTL